MAQALQLRSAVARRAAGRATLSAAAAAELLCVALALLLLVTGHAAAQATVRPGSGAEWAPQSVTAASAGGGVDFHDFDAVKWPAGATQQVSSRHQWRQICLWTPEQS